MFVIFDHILPKRNINKHMSSFKSEENPQGWWKRQSIPQRSWFGQLLVHEVSLDHSFLRLMWTAIHTSGYWKMTFIQNFPLFDINLICFSCWRVPHRIGLSLLRIGSTRHCLKCGLEHGLFSSCHSVKMWSHME